MHFEPIQYIRKCSCYTIIRKDLPRNFVDNDLTDNLDFVLRSRQWRHVSIPRLWITYQQRIGFLSNRLLCTSLTSRPDTGTGCIANLCNVKKRFCFLTSRDCWYQCGMQRQQPQQTTRDEYESPYLCSATVHCQMSQHPLRRS